PWRLNGSEPLAALRRGRRPRPVDRGEVCGESRAGDALPAVELLDPLAGGGAEPTAEVAVLEQRLDRRTQRSDVAGRDEDAGLAVLDQVREPAHGGRDDGLPVRHRLRADDAEALGERRADDDGGALVAALELCARD